MIYFEMVFADLTYNVRIVQQLLLTVLCMFIVRDLLLL